MVQKSPGASYDSPPKPLSRREKIIGGVLVGLLFAGAATVIGVASKDTYDQQHHENLDTQKGTSEYAYNLYYQDYVNPYPENPYSDFDPQEAKCLNATPYDEGHQITTTTTHTVSRHPANEAYDPASDVLTVMPGYGEQGALVLRLTGFKAGGQLLAPVDIASEQILDQNHCDHAPLVEPGN